MTSSKTFALVGGAAMLGMGIASFVPQLSVAPRKAGLPRLDIETSYGKFLGVFPLNVFNKVALTVFGAAGIAVSQLESERPAMLYARAVAFAMGPLAVLGAIPRTRTLFGKWPLFGAEVVAHGAFAAAGAVTGFRGNGVRQRARR
ncbi:MAG: DUF4383 domain-containing protein [Kofleriaceae bacterium]|nr:DUF4383 domain-containing protein [Kofleriaceae bacterium]